MLLRPLRAGASNVVTIAAAGRAAWPASSSTGAGEVVSTPRCCGSSGAHCRSLTCSDTRVVKLDGRLTTRVYHCGVWTVEVDLTYYCPSGESEDFPTKKRSDHGCLLSLSLIISDEPESSTVNFADWVIYPFFN